MATAKFSGDGLRFSIIIPCRDDEKHLEEAVASVLSQQVELEVIVVDDGSDPAIRQPGDPRVRLIRLDAPVGPAGARNAGIRAASGDVIGFCDSDDVYAPGRLAWAAGLHQSADVVVVGQSWLDPQGRGTMPVLERRELALRSFTPHLGATTVLRSACPEMDDGFWPVRTSSGGFG